MGESTQAAREELRKFLAYVHVRDLADTAFVRISRQAIAEQAHALGLDVAKAIRHAEGKGWLIRVGELPGEFDSAYFISGQVTAEPVAEDTPEQAATESLDAGRYPVTLLQAAGVVNRSKRTLEGWARDDADFPLPDVEGGGGRAHEWQWGRFRPYLANKTGQELPEWFPADTSRPDWGTVEAAADNHRKPPHHTTNRNPHVSPAILKTSDILHALPPLIS